MNEESLNCLCQSYREYPKNGEFIAEGVRFSANKPELKKVSDIKSEKDLAGYDGYIFGCPTYHRDMTAGMKSFLCS